MLNRIFASVLFAALAGPCCQASETLRPLSPVEAGNLGLGDGDGVLLRAGEPSHGDFGDLVDQITGGSRYISYSATEMRGISSQTYLAQTSGGVWCDSASDDGFADMVISDLPSSASLQVMRIWGLDADANDDLTVSLIRRCYPTDTSGGVITTVLAELNPAESTGNFSSSLFLPTTTIDNNSCSYTVRTRFSTPGSGFACADSNLRLQKVRFQWVP